MINNDHITKISLTIQACFFTEIHDFVLGRKAETKREFI